MSSTIKAAILALKGRIADAYTAVSQKGGTLPATQDSANLPAAIASIPSGSSLPLVYVKTFGLSANPLGTIADLNFLYIESSTFNGFQSNPYIKEMYNIRGNVGNAVNLFYNDYVLERVSFADFTIYANAGFFRCGFWAGKWMDFTGLKLAATETSDLLQFTGASVETIIGDHTLEEVLNGLSALTGKATSFGFNYSLLRRADYRAIINGLADLTGQTAQTMTIGSANIAKLTADDIAIATAKNWTLA